MNMIVALISVVFLFLFTVSFHELAHGYVAALFGDDTARRQGRLTLNPLKHIDFFWTVLFPCILLISTAGQFVMGMAKPVPVDFKKLGNTRWGLLFVPLAGPAANLMLAAAAALIYHRFAHPILTYTIWLNLGLGIFNLLPIPPLDGSKVLAHFAPAGWARFFRYVEPYGFFIVLALYLGGWLTAAVLPAIDFFCRLLRVPSISM